MDIMVLDIFQTMYKYQNELQEICCIVRTLHMYRVFAQHLFETGHSYDKISDIMDIVYID